MLALADDRRRRNLRGASVEALVLETRSDLEGARLTTPVTSIVLPGDHNVTVIPMRWNQAAAG
jgi:hypothetical protein